MADDLARRLSEFVHDKKIEIDSNFKVYESSVHAVVDCIFSSQTRYEAVKNVMERLNARLPDRPDLNFSEFIRDIEQVGPEEYARDVLKNQQQIAGRLKTEICRDVASFFTRRGYDTKMAFQLPPEPEAQAYAEKKADLERLILQELVEEVEGIGPVLARYLLLLLGDESAVKPDTIITRLFEKLSSERFPMGDKPAMKRIEAAIQVVAVEQGVTPARLDNALWSYERGSRKAQT